MAIKKQRIIAVERISRLSNGGEATPGSLPGFPGKKRKARMALRMPLLIPQGIP
jgi:hypothetical protein